MFLYRFHEYPERSGVADVVMAASLSAGPADDAPARRLKGLSDHDRCCHRDAVLSAIWRAKFFAGVAGTHKGIHIPSTQMVDGG
ncbi:hypothetical protein [Pseudotabrizicola sp. 4114]|uniref:hypothetical protein n=1 Tax=Pseudotabrizicola sp. 4114 TaxID=2817731 RepID=UPI00285F8A60|nr:hypothetical protein [Pseudorhodobacter sp. 4114]